MFRTSVNLPGGDDRGYDGDDDVDHIDHVVHVDIYIMMQCLSVCL